MSKTHFWTLCCYLTSFFFLHAYLQFSTMWILWDWKCDYGFFQITHAKNSSNPSSSTRDLTRFFGICDLEKPILTFPPHSILSLQIRIRIWYKDCFLVGLFCVKTKFGLFRFFKIWNSVHIWNSEFVKPLIVNSLNIIISIYAKKKLSVTINL